MRIGLIIANNVWFSPYVSIYTRFFDKMHIKYDVISWNRDGKEESEGFQYGKKVSGSASLFEYIGYIRFVKKVIKQENFDKLILFGSQTAILLSCVLLFHYRNNFIIDYRDLSIEQKKGFYQIFSLLTRYSFANVISSPGFKKCLPQRNYLISHNFDTSTVERIIDEDTETDFKKNGVVSILTIGGIRDYDSNIEVVKALANQEGFQCDFVGKGFSAQLIENYCKENVINNVTFYGYYKKEEESLFVKKSTFMNIFYPRKISHDTAMSNRFYNSLIYKRPMIVTKNTIQGDYVEKYGVGIAIDNCSDIKNKLLSFLRGDFKKYSLSCNSLLRRFLEDERLFSAKLKDFVS